VKKIFLVILLLISCSSVSEEDYYNDDTSAYKNINYITITNENTGGGSQYVYVVSGFSQTNVQICYCDSSCSKETFEVSTLQFDENTLSFRYKLSPYDEFTTKSTIDWCTKFG
jgi:hypothetical protein